MRVRAAAIAALMVGVLACASSTAGADCSTSGCRADVGMWGSSIPNPITPSTSSSSLLYFYAKDNGPAPAYGIEVHINVPSGLKILYARDYSARGPCVVKGTYVSCDFGNFKREQEAVAVLKVRPRGQQGTFEIPAHEYSQGVDDPNGGNNQITVTLSVYPHGHGG